MLLMMVRSCLTSCRGLVLLLLFRGDLVFIGRGTASIVGGCQLCTPSCVVAPLAVVIFLVGASSVLTLFAGGCGASSSC